MLDMEQKINISSSSSGTFNNNIYGTLLEINNKWSYLMLLTNLVHSTGYLPYIPITYIRKESGANRFNIEFTSGNIYGVINVNSDNTYTYVRKTFSAS